MKVNTFIHEVIQSLLSDCLIAEMYLYYDLYLTLLQLTIILKPDRPKNRLKLISFCLFFVTFSDFYNQSETLLVSNSTFVRKEIFSINPKVDFFLV